MTEDIIITIIVMTLFITLYITILYFAIEVQKKRRAEGKKKFFKALFEGLKIDSIKSLDEVANLYKGATSQSAEDLQYRYGLSKQLREFLVELTAKNTGIFGENLDENKIVQWSQKINEFIVKNEEIFPYADLPAAERNILTDISIYADNKDAESTKRKLSELAGLIQGKNDELIRTSKTNRWAVPLSVIGIILTIIFGILAVTNS